jgi:hypothetical protein
MKTLVLLAVAMLLLGGCVVAAPYPDTSYAYGYGPVPATTTYVYTTPAPGYVFAAPSPGYYYRDGYYYPYPYRASRYWGRQAP